MSFSKNVKSELCSASEKLGKKKNIFLYGLLYGMKYSDDRLVLQTENEGSIALAVKLLALRDKPEITEWKKRNGSLFQLSVPVSDLSPLECYHPADEVSPEITGGNDENIGLFLRGVFLSCGSITDPGKEYHLELTLPSEAKCDAIFRLINEQGMTIKQSTRAGQRFLYTKESERIADFLTFTGAMLHSMEIMNVKILKEIRNNVNRGVNCETANVEKTAIAAEKQVQDIELIFSVKGKGFLPEELLQVAEMRIENIDMSLRDIADSLNPPISRSGVNHRFRRIADIAEKIRRGEK